MAAAQLFNTLASASLPVFHITSLIRKTWVAPEPASAAPTRSVMSCIRAALQIVSALLRCEKSPPHLLWMWQEGMETTHWKLR